MPSKHHCLILLVACLMCTLWTSVLAGQHESTKKGSVRQLKARRAMTYAFPNEHGGLPPTGVESRDTGRTPLGTSVFDKSNGAVSPGVTVGDTWYDYQHNGSMGRMVEKGPYGSYTGEAMVHFAWMQLPAAAFIMCRYYYNVYYTGAGSLGGATGLNADNEYAGYVNIDVTPDNRAVVGGHQQIKAKYAPHMYFDFGPGFYYWSQTRVPDALQAYYQEGGSGDEANWPKFTYQYGDDTVLHVVAMISEDADVAQAAIYYFRKVGYDDAGTWDSPPKVIDTCTDISHDVTCDRDGNKVALVWLADLNYQQTACDTCSGTSVYPGLLSQADNDVYYQISYNQGVTWQPRVNLTEIEPGEAAMKAYCDLSSMIDTDGNLHILWAATPWAADPLMDGSNIGGETVWNSRMLHWSEAFDNVTNPAPYIRIVADHTYEIIDSCGPPAWAVVTAKPSISECDGKFYAIWSQFNDVPGGVIDDCAAWGLQGDYSWGATNAEIWVSVSSDAGVTWDAQRNLTNSYSKGCDPTDPAGEPCQSDYWATMSRIGSANQVGENWSGAVVVDPTGCYAGSYNDGKYYYLDVMYVHDPDAGGIVQDEGSWQSADINWFRLACVEPIPNPNFTPGYWGIGDPAWTHPGTILDTVLEVQNTGNVTLNYSVTVQQDNGPAGWLTIGGFSGSLASGFDNTEVGQIHMNASAVVHWAYTIPYELRGRLIFNGNDPDLPDTISISMIVADTLQTIIWDTIYTDCISLVVSNTAETGRQGEGRVNMDFVNADDCDTTADIYLYDASPMVGWVLGADTSFNWSIWDADMFDPLGFRPISGEQHTTLCTNDAKVFQSGTFVTHDSSIALERIWFAPTGTAPNCNYVIQYLKVWSNDGLAHSDLVIGEGLDWDIPNDSGNAYNAGGISPTKKLVYQIGTEYNQDDTTYPYNCQFNDDRFGGIAFIASYYNGVASGRTDPFCAFAETNDSLKAMTGFKVDAMYEQMTTAGYRRTDSVLDLHSAMCYEPYYDLSPTGYYEVFSVLAAVEDGTVTDLEAATDAARTWFTAHGGRAMVADLDDNGIIDICDAEVVDCGNIDGDLAHIIDISDLVYLVNYMYAWGPPPSDPNSANVDGCPGIDIGDLTTLVKYLFWGWNEICPENADCTDKGSGQIVLDHVDGRLDDGMQSLVADGSTEITFYLRYVNHDYHRLGISNGFRVYSPDGAQWNAFIADTVISGMKSRFDCVFAINNFSTDGSGADTVGFAGGTLFSGTGLPAGFDEVCFSITIGPIDPQYHGRTIVLDSSFFPPQNEFKWAEYIAHPAWGGPYAFAIVDTSRTCPADFNGDSDTDLGDLTYLLSYLYGVPPGPAPLNPDSSDLDNYELLTIRDFAYFFRQIYYSGSTFCPPMYSPLHMNGQLRDSVYAHTYESVLPYPDILPPQQSIDTVHFHVTNDVALEGGTFPLSIRVGGDIPEIVSVSMKSSNQLSHLNVCGADSLRGVVFFSTCMINPDLPLAPDYYLRPGTHEIGLVVITVPPLVDVWRPVIIAWDSMPPIQGGAYINQPWAAAVNGAVWRPNIYRFPCEGIRGNVTGDAADQIDIADLVWLVSYMFDSPAGDPPKSFEEADINGDLQLDIADLVHFVSYMFGSGPPPVVCP